MRPIPLSVLATLLLTCALAQAEETSPQPLAAATSAEAQADTLEQRLAQSEQLRSEQQANSAAQMQRLRQENQRLRLQLKESQARQQPGLLSEEQTWFALGAGLSLLSVLVGALLRGRRKTRREWIN
ncbi:translation initiation factor 2 (IF-2, GTPase) [Pseudomonas sp. AOB-7]|uniref:translation initiation factor 2 (IF-2, GTPase) n=1 Tax=Pseudomonas sp. AOB-7 TaxID=2482750 RepID=UPI000EFB03F9|nr:translation initiation factor 2 (IF-2, GTPase) [Pseudomonas sp. AOB-7]RMH84907.1 translation initiation factor 2 (IF-2, GTPase) [Pseudomonas sp. AOB-7]